MYFCVEVQKKSDSFSVTVDRFTPSTLLFSEMECRLQRVGDTMLAYVFSHKLCILFVN